MPELERALREVRVDWPPTPDIAGAVRSTIAAEAPPGPIAARRRGRWPAWRRRLAYALVALLAGAAAVEPARSAILELFGLKAAKIERREPDAPPAPSPRAPLGADLGLGRPVTLAQASRAAGFRPGVPRRLGRPDAVYIDSQLGISLVYAPRRDLPESGETGAGLLVTQVLGQVTPYIEKAAGPGTAVERLEIDGDPAYHLSGAPHGFAYRARAGDVRFEDQRLAGSTLLVEHGDLLLRIEGEIPLTRAVEIARAITATFEP